VRQSTNPFLSAFEKDLEQRKSPLAETMDAQQKPGTPTIGDDAKEMFVSCPNY
jgi:hypothetical protein